MKYSDLLDKELKIMVNKDTDRKEKQIYIKIHQGIHKMM